MIKSEISRKAGSYWFELEDSGKTVEVTFPICIIDPVNRYVVITEWEEDLPFHYSALKWRC
jgi:hypothetical protein